MSTLKEIESAIKLLSPQELAKFRQWYYEFDQDDWDRQIEADAASGKLDALANEALAEDDAGMTRPL